MTNREIVTGHHVFVNHHGVTMMNGEASSDGGRRLDFIAEQAFGYQPIPHQHRRGPQIIQHVFFAPDGAEMSNPVGQHHAARAQAPAVRANIFQHA
ncbi:hypothetical protein SDC9_175928 [bioreactor metagenome]|uniref:Uncharacterized protein n=1 Tax=bioreactor metagenome TaxID=1076179 RepID=A0A645GQM2_9ZZZZ